MPDLAVGFSVTETAWSGRGLDCAWSGSEFETQTTMTGLAVEGAMRTEGIREGGCRAIPKGWGETARGEANDREGASKPSIADEPHASEGTTALLDTRESVLGSRTGERPRWGVVAMLEVPERTSPLPLGKAALQ